MEEEAQKVDLITLLRTFKKEGLDNFIVIRKEKFENNFIPKSKVKEKIEELNSRIEKYREYTEQGIETDIEWVDNVADRETVKVLQDLLERSREDVRVL